MVALPLIVAIANSLIAEQPCIDRGDVRIGPPLVQTFHLQNLTNEPIHIEKVHSTCGCLAPKLDRTTLAPGEKATLTVEVNTLSQPAGKIAWITNVEWRSSTDNGQLGLTLKANLMSEVKVEPAAVAFHIRQSRSIDVAINDTRARPFRITGVGTTIPNVKAETIPTADLHNQRIRLTAHPDGPTGVYTAVAWFTTDDPHYPQIRVPITLHVPARTRVTASPSVLFLDGGHGRILLRDADGQKVIIDRVECEGPITATIKESVISVRADQKKWDGTPTTGNVVVHLKAPTVESISIAVDVR